MATYATTSGAASAPAFGVHPASQQEHTQQQHLHHQVSQISLDQHYQQQQQQQQQAQAQAQLQQTQQPQQSIPQPADDGPTDSAGSVRSNNGVSRGLGILNKLGLDRRTNRGKY